MEEYWDKLINTRSNFLKLVEGLTPELLNLKPQNFNNNIVWNFGHIVVTAETLCYRLSGLQPNIDEAYVNKYKKGTRPDAFISQDEINFLKSILFSSIQQIQSDLTRSHFVNFRPYKTEFGAELKTIDEACRYICIHDALHFGYAMALKRIVG